MPAETDHLTPVVRGLAPTLLDTDVANAVLDMCAAFRDLKIVGRGKFVINGRSATIQLAPDLGSGGGGSSGTGTMRFRVPIGGIATDVDITVAELA